MTSEEESQDSSEARTEDADVEVPQAEAWVMEASAGISSKEASYATISVPLDIRKELTSETSEERSQTHTISNECERDPGPVVTHGAVHKANVIFPGYLSPPDVSVGDDISASSYSPESDESPNTQEFILEESIDPEGVANEARNYTAGVIPNVMELKPPDKGGSLKMFLTSSPGGGGTAISCNSSQEDSQNLKQKDVKSKFEEEEHYEDKIKDFIFSEGKISPQMCVVSQDSTSTTTASGTSGDDEILEICSTHESESLNSRFPEEDFNEIETRTVDFTPRSSEKTNSLELDETREDLLVLNSFSSKEAFTYELEDVSSEDQLLQRAKGNGGGIRHDEEAADDFRSFDNESMSMARDEFDNDRENGTHEDMDEDKSENMNQNMGENRHVVAEGDKHSDGDETALTPLDRSISNEDLVGTKADSKCTFVEDGASLCDLEVDRSETSPLTKDVLLKEFLGKERNLSSKMLQKSVNTFIGTLHCKDAGHINSSMTPTESQQVERHRSSTDESTYPTPEAHAASDILIEVEDAPLDLSPFTGEKRALKRTAHESQLTNRNTKKARLGQEPPEQQKDGGKEELPQELIQAVDNVRAPESSPQNSTSTERTDVTEGVSHNEKFAMEFRDAVAANRKLRKLHRKELEGLMIELFVDKVLYEHKLGQQKDLCQRLEATLNTNRKKTYQFYKEVQKLKKTTKQLSAEHSVRKQQQQHVISLTVKRSVGIQATPSIIENRLMHTLSPKTVGVLSSEPPTNATHNRPPQHSGDRKKKHNEAVIEANGAVLSPNQNETAKGTCVVASHSATTTTTSSLSRGAQMLMVNPVVVQAQNVPRFSVPVTVSSGSSLLAISRTAGASLATSSQGQVVALAPSGATMNQLVFVPSAPGQPPAALVLTSAANSQPPPGANGFEVKQSLVSSVAQFTTPTSAPLEGTSVVLNGGFIAGSRFSVPPRPIQRHPAPLPPTPPQLTLGYSKKIPLAPILKLAHKESSIILSWNMVQTEEFERAASFQLFAYQEGTTTPASSLWKKVGSVKALELPMACTLTQFVAGHVYHFAVRAVDIRARLGPFSEPRSIQLGSTFGK